MKQGENVCCTDECRKCKGMMIKSKAIKETASTGIADFYGNDIVQTMSAGGPGTLVNAYKCEKCGWSVTRV